MISPTGIAHSCRKVPLWWEAKFQVSDKFSQEEPPFAPFCNSRLFRPKTEVWVKMVTEMVCISAKNLPRSAYQDVSCTDYRLRFLS